ncbi:hypothetical protein [Sediminibacillus halophilus]|uniref:Uncharacterized protein n=1 Tax=Sediminibacillus halophilus TaxID=482461 RepID=A0A1G9QVL3_9BACI|nr:hypothetical protein [Sediminibacillus halophilus]SDM15056.1 hypothetical protein SAMN05216244_1689 [Sediminibacillus halophilus]
MARGFSCILLGLQEFPSFLSYFKAKVDKGLERSKVMKNERIKKKEKDPIEEKLNGYALGLALLLVSGFLYFYPMFLGNKLVSNVVGALIGVFGLLGLFMELEKSDKKFKSAYNYINVGIVTSFIIAVLLFVFSNLLVNIIVLLLSLFALYTFLLGFLYVAYIIISEGGIKYSIKKIPMFILNFLIFILTVLQLLKILNILE